MHLRRLKPSPTDGPAYYHCILRVVDQPFTFKAAEKEHFRDLMRDLKGERKHHLESPPR